MPIYEYQCQECGNRTEALQKMADPPLTECAVCGGPLKRLISTPAVQFKGSGWYVTDYARKSGGAASKGEGSSGETKTDAPAGGSKPSESMPSESKPAAAGTGGSSASTAGSSGGSGGSSSGSGSGGS